MSKLMKYGIRVNYTKVDNEVMDNEELSIGAKLTYYTLCSIHSSEADIPDTSFAAKMKVGISTYKRWKKELVDSGIIQVIKDGPRRYRILICHGSKTKERNERSIENGNTLR